MTKQEENVTLIPLYHSGMFKDLLVLILRERIASVDYDHKLEGRERDVQNFELNELRLAIRTRLRSFYDANLYVVSRFTADLSKPAGAIHFSIQPRKGPATTQQHFRVELPPELWAPPEDRMADIVGNMLAENPTAFDPASFSTPETRKP